MLTDDISFSLCFLHPLPPFCSSPRSLYPSLSPPFPHLSSPSPFHPLPFQRRQLDILLSGFQERGELAGLLVDEEWMGDTGEGWVSAPHVKKLFGLCDRMVDYLHEATVRGCGVYLYPNYHD